METKEIIDFLIKDGGQFIVEGHYYIHSKRVYAGGDTFEEALKNWWEKYQEKIKLPEYIELNNYHLLKKSGEQF